MLLLVEWIRTSQYRSSWILGCFGHHFLGIRLWFRSAQDSWLRCRPWGVHFDQGVVHLTRLGDEGSWSGRSRLVRRLSRCWAIRVGVVSEGLKLSLWNSQWGWIWCSALLKCEFCQWMRGFLRFCCKKCRAWVI